MLEQQKSPAQDQNAAKPRSTTELEGIRQKVFMDRYSLKDASGQPLEFYPEQTWERVARGIAAVLVGRPWATSGHAALVAATSSEIVASTRASEPVRP